MKRTYWLGVLLLGGVSVAAAQQALTLTINGRAIPEGALLFKGKSYVSVEALKAAGVVVQSSGTQIALTLPATSGAGGANQQGAVEGKGGEWLFNGIWRFQVYSVEKADPATDGNGWKVTVEIRNGSKFSGYAPSGTGWKGITLVLDDGNALAARSDAADLRDAGLAQGAANKQTLFFPQESDSKSKPVRLILRFDPQGLEGTPAGLRYTVPDPSFRVDVRGVVRPNCR